VCASRVSSARGRPTPEVVADGSGSSKTYVPATGFAWWYPPLSFGSWPGRHCRSGAFWAWQQRLADIQAAIDAIRSHLRRGDLPDGLVFDAIRIRLLEIGEAVQALPAELLDQAHLRAVLADYQEHYNTARPPGHQPARPGR
jgi:hypothetical protein